MNPHNPFHQIIMWCGAQISFIISINVEAGLDLIFKALSIVSVSLIIAINFKKGIESIKEVWKKIKPKNKSKNNTNHLN